MFKTMIHCDIQILIAHMRLKDSDLISGAQGSTDPHRRGEALLAQGLGEHGVDRTTSGARFPWGDPKKCGVFEGKIPRKYG